jgi:hypothetical protein
VGFVTEYLAYLWARLDWILAIHRAAVPTFVLALHTLSTILNPHDASGRLSRLMAASSPGAFMAQPNTSPHPPFRHLHMQRSHGQIHRG